MSFKTTQLREIEREMFSLGYKKFSDYWTDFDVSIGSILLLFFFFRFSHVLWFKCIVNDKIYVFSFSIKPYMLNLSQNYFCSRHIDYTILRVFLQCTVQGTPWGTHTNSTKDNKTGTQPTYFFLQKRVHFQSLIQRKGSFSGRHGVWSALPCIFILKTEDAYHAYILVWCLQKSTAWLQKQSLVLLVQGMDLSNVTKLFH